MKKATSNPTPGTHIRILKLIQNNYFLNVSLNMVNRIQMYLIQKLGFFQATLVSLIFNLISSTSLYFLLSLSFSPINYMHLSRHDYESQGVAVLSQTHHFLSCIWDNYHCIQAFKVFLLDLNFLNQLAIASSLNVWVTELLFPSVLAFSIFP